MNTSLTLDLIIASVNYADFLEITLPLNKKHFNKIVILTTPEDLETQKICKENSVECFVTEKFKYNGATFDRGSAFNEAVSFYKFTDFLLHLDGDIVLPDNFKELIIKSNLDPEMFYGSQRIFIPTYEEWVAYTEERLDLKKMLEARRTRFRLFSVI